jgi:hypothetical protein
VSDQSSKKKRGGDPRTPGATDENDRPTVNPPFDVEAFARAASSPSFDPEPRSEQITLTNEVELELARFQSAKRSEPPRATTPPALSMANANAPSVPEMPAQRALSPTSIEAAVLGAIAGPAAPEISERTIDDPLAEMGERFALGDYTGALEMADIILAEDPGNLEAAECGENCRTVLESMYAARLAPLDRAPIVVVPPTQMRWLSIDHRAGFILSLVDGSSTVETILDLSGMPKLDALRILNELVQQKVVAFR